MDSMETDTGGKTHTGVDFGQGFVNGCDQFGCDQFGCDQFGCDQFGNGVANNGFANNGGQFGCDQFGQFGCDQFGQFGNGFANNGGQFGNGFANNGGQFGNGFANNGGQFGNGFANNGGQFGFANNGFVNNGCDQYGNANNGEMNGNVNPPVTVRPSTHWDDLTDIDDCILDVLGDEKYHTIASVARAAGRSELWCREHMRRRVGLYKVDHDEVRARLCAGTIHQWCRDAMNYLREREQNGTRFVPLDEFLRDTRAPDPQTWGAETATLVEYAGFIDDTLATRVFVTKRRIGSRRNVTVIKLNDRR